MPEQTGQTRDHSNFHGYLARNLSDAYRLAVISLEDPIAAQTIVHDAIIATWTSPGARSEHELDDAFRRELDAATAMAIRLAGPANQFADDDPIEAAIAGLSPELQLVLVRSYGPWGPRIEHERAPLSALAARMPGADAATAPAADLEARLRALYEARDPGTPAPLPLRMRLQEDEDRAIASDAAAAARDARGRRRLNWSFGVNTILGLTALVLVIALASVIDVRASAVASADPTRDPSSPLTIADVAVVQQGIDGSAVHVGATQRTLIATFAGSSMWHASDRQCLADVVGTINWDGSASWVGQRAGHVESIAGDPSSMSALITGLGSYCQFGQSVSADGGVTWSSGAQPGSLASGPTWLAFDPAHAHTILAYSTGTLSLSADSGSKWTTRQSSVVPLAFDSTGRLVGWTSGKLLQSIDDGASWQETGPGPTDRPAAAGATSTGAFIGGSDGLWWYPLTAAPGRLEPGSVFSIATMGDDALVLGADAAGRPWLGTAGSAVPGISLTSLPPELANLQISGGGLAANDGGAVVAFSGAASTIAFVTFVY
ncbi:MAG TPA: hypothetical protein VF344_08460 [Candidatus Limnocylindrales bacterium]